jgi:hypothetical protein
MTVPNADCSALSVDCATRPDPSVEGLFEAAALACVHASSKLCGRSFEAAGVLETPLLEPMSTLIPCPRQYLYSSPDIGLARHILALCLKLLIHR